MRRWTEGGILPTAQRIALDRLSQMRTEKTNQNKTWYTCSELSTLRPYTGYGLLRERESILVFLVKICVLIGRTLYRAVRQCRSGQTGFFYGYFLFSFFRVFLVFFFTD